MAPSLFMLYILTPTPSSRRFERHTVTLPSARAFDIEGRTIAISSEMIPMTVSSSIRVKAGGLARDGLMPSLYLPHPVSGRGEWTGLASRHKLHPTTGAVAQLGERLHGMQEVEG